jgi:nucleoside-diphosphate-sugar epimerase
MWMRVFLTGATGYMGGVVLERLLRANVRVLGFARAARRGELVTWDGLEWLYGELDDANAIRFGARATDATIHLAARHDENMERLDAAAVHAIADALRGSGKAFITTSASPVYGHTGLTPRDEREPVEEPYPGRLFRLEHDRLVAGLNAYGVRGVVLRPPFVYGRAGGFLVTLIDQAVKDGVARTIGDGSNRWSTVHVDDLANLYLLALFNDRAAGVYNAGSTDTASMREIADAITINVGNGITVGPWSEAQAVDRLGPLMPMMALEQRISSERAYSGLGWVPGDTTLLKDLIAGSYRESPLVSYSH